MMRRQSLRQNLYAPEAKVGIAHVPVGAVGERRVEILHQRVVLVHKLTKKCVSVSRGAATRGRADGWGRDERAEGGVADARRVRRAKRSTNFLQIPTIGPVEGSRDRSTPLRHWQDGLYGRSPRHISCSDEKRVPVGSADVVRVNPKYAGKLGHTLGLAAERGPGACLNIEEREHSSGLRRATRGKERDSVLCARHRD